MVDVPDLGAPDPVADDGDSLLGGDDCCRYCYMEAAPNQPLFYPCHCSGSMRYVHQDCLDRWLSHNKKQLCEVCGHKFTFKPIYKEDMPRHLPVNILISGLTTTILKALGLWFHYTIVAIAWLLVVPLSACRIYKFIFNQNGLTSILTLPLSLVTPDNFFTDVFYGFFIVTASIAAFVALVWLREQIINGAAPDWMDIDLGRRVGQENAAAAPAGRPAGVPAADDPVIIVPPADDNAAPVVDDAEVVPPNPDENAVPDVPVEPVDDAAAADEWADVDDPANADAGNDAGNNNGDIFERAAEELTWERMLGLDGSLIFLEHVFWVISLNGAFVFLFVYCPYHMGRLISIVAGLADTMAEMEGFLYFLFGYISIAMSALILYYGTSYLEKQIGIFPLLSGWWIDVCTLSLFDVTWSQRAEWFHSAPATALFIHWMVGMVFVFYYASFVMSLREILRPGVLWFLRNFSDPEFNPVLEMIRLSILNHVRRFLVSSIVFGTTIMLALLLPAKSIKWLLPKFLPYQITLMTDAPVSELSMELLLLQVILPAILDQAHIQAGVKVIVLFWAKCVGQVLSLRSYLLGENDGPVWNTGGRAAADHANNNHRPAVPEPAEGDVNDHPPGIDEEPEVLNAPVPAPVPVQPAPGAADNGVNDGGLQAAHLAMLQMHAVSERPQSFVKPSLFPIRIILLILATMATVYLVCCSVLFIPTLIGRKLMSFWFGDLRVHELYTCACGVYICWGAARTAACLCSWAATGWFMFEQKIKNFCVLIFKLAIAAFFCVGVIPLLMGLFFDILVVMPIRVSFRQTPVFFLWQSWALGVLHAKIFCALTLIGPNWWLKTVLDRVCRNGLSELDIYFVLRKLVAPVIAVLAVLLSIPYFLSFVVMPIVIGDLESQYYLFQKLYPCVISLFSLVFFFHFQVNQIQQLYIKIKNDRYLVGQMLQNFEKDQPKAN